ncbi:MAG: peptide chain release factor 2 [bacterium]|nr:peptide chain release factor 2 [bacterium]
MTDIRSRLGVLETKVAKLGGYFDPAALRKEIEEGEQIMAQPEFWADRKKAQEISQRIAGLRDEMETLTRATETVREISEWADLLTAEPSEEMEKDLERKLANAEKEIRALEVRFLLGGEFDTHDVIMSIHAGAGGTEAQDWAEMLARMYGRFAERRGFKTQVLDESKGAEAGIKSITFRVQGRYAYGYLKSEHGVHRLVRISPFDAEKMRHTSFALVEVIPELEEVAEIEIDPKDLRIDTFLSSGHGGQSVQTTYSAVRIVHLPTGITVTCQNERSQLQNKETALKVLKSKLHQRYLIEQQAVKSELRGEYTSAEWGNQIRSYVLHPYQMVKDHRTKYETADTEGILNGEIDAFIEAFLRWKAESKKI